MVKKRNGRKNKGGKSTRKYLIAGVVVVLIAVIAILNFAPIGNFFIAFENILGPEEVLSVDQVDYIPKIKLSECLFLINKVNPHMKIQTANDNCMTIDAVNAGDPSVCDKVSKSFRPVCLKQFGL